MNSNQWIGRFWKIKKWLLSKKSLYRFQRAGILPYLIDKQGNVLYCMGEDTASGNLTDFGGHVEKKKDRNAFKAALREFREETRDSFPLKGLLFLEQFALVSFDNSMLLIFLPIFSFFSSVTQLAKEISYRFHNPNHKLYFYEQEIRELVWIPDKEMEDVFFSKTIYKKVFLFIAKRWPFDIIRDSCGELMEFIMSLRTEYPAIHKLVST